MLRNLLFAFTIILIVILSSCSSSLNITNLDRTDQEAIFLGKIEVVDSESKAIHGLTMFIDGTFTTSTYIQIDNTNYVSFKVPLGKHYFTSMSTSGNALTFLPIDSLSFGADRPGVYYLGDIRIVWNDYKSFMDNNPLTGGMKHEPVRQKRGKDIPKKTPVNVSDNKEITSAKILARFQASKEFKVEKSLLLVK